MDEMVFAALLIFLQDAWDEVISEVDLIELLYDGVADAAGVTTEDGQMISVTKGTEGMSDVIFERMLRIRELLVQ